ncbi:MAG TPA: MOSC domain-containing protein [Pyrinomonadaceae bacterium]|nr:MOSC domain-containing protein [Acidobacteriota bacterium]HQZ97384.1 MOSC domain-containing protein [Pyrinomonadaceae bacterium]
MNISEINIYPIKSLKGITLDSALVEPRGLQHDRRWMLTTPDGMFFTQREFPQMATVEVGVGDDLYVTAAGFGTLEIPLEPETGDKQQVTIWDSVCEGEVYSPVVNEWFSDVIGEPCQLVYMGDDSRRDINERFNKGGEVVSFADGYPLLVIGEASLEDLNQKLRTNANGSGAFHPLAMNRFRPNIVVSDSNAFAEDRWDRISVGDAVFRGSKPCARCVITTIDQSRGEFDGKEPLKTLASYRMAKEVIPDRIEAFGMSETAVLFGQNLVAETPGVSIRVGDELKVIN